MSPVVADVDVEGSPTKQSNDTRPGQWQKQLREAIQSLDDIQSHFPRWVRSRSELEKVVDRYPTRVPAYYASLIDSDNPDDPLGRMVLPDVRELLPNRHLLPDPQREEDHMPVGRLVRRYPDRALVVATTRCAAYCRYCTRKRLVGRGPANLSNDELDSIVGFLRDQPQIKEIILSGGDPLTLGEGDIDRILTRLRSVDSVETIRLATRVPAVLPMRITSRLVEVLARHHPLFVCTHFNHPRELTPEATAACGRLADAGIPLNNQSVLLAGVNDDPRIFMELCRCLLKTRVRPYYLFQCDLVEGVEHLRTPLFKGIEIMEHLRGRLSGLAIPTFVVDPPRGGVKIPLLPPCIVSRRPGSTVLRDGEGRQVTYPDPAPLRRNEWPNFD